MAYYNPQDAGGNVAVTPRKDINRSAAHQLLPPGIETKVNRTVDHFSASQLFEGKGLGNPGSPSMPDGLARLTGIDPLTFQAGDMSRNNTKYVKNLVENLEYDHRMSSPTARSGEFPLRSYGTVPGPLAPAAPTPGPGAIFRNNSLEMLSGRATMPQPGYSPALGPQTLISKQALLNPASGIDSQNVDAIKRTLESLPQSVAESTYVPSGATDPQKIVARGGIAENPQNLTRYDPYYGMKFDASRNPAGLSSAIQSAEKAAHVQRLQPATTHPSRQKFQFSDGQMRGLADEENLHDPNTYQTAPTRINWKVLGHGALITALAVTGLYLVRK